MFFLYCPGKSQKGLSLKCVSRQWRPRVTFGQRITTNAFNPKNKTYFAQTIDHSPIIMFLLCWQKILAIEISVCPQKNANTCSRVENRVLFWKEIYGALRSNQVLFAPQSIWRRKPWKGLFVMGRIPHNSHGNLKVVGNSFQYFPRLTVWWVIRTTLYRLMPKSWYQQTAQSLGNELLLIVWHWIGYHSNNMTC